MPAKVHRGTTDLKELASKTDLFLGELKHKKSLVFTYCNYSNPLTGDDHKYLLVGAGLISDVTKPQDYDMSDEFLRSMRSSPNMKNFPKSAWQFKIRLDPECSFVLPYQEYLQWYDSHNSDIHDDGAVPVPAQDVRGTAVEDMMIPIEESNMIPDFKYVSKHISHDKAIYLLYLLRRSLRSMKKDGLIDSGRLDRIDMQLDRMLEIAWKERGRYPSLDTALRLILEKDFDEQLVPDLASEMRNIIKDDFENLDRLPPDMQESNGRMVRVCRIIKNQKKELEFLSRFDFSDVQLNHVIGLLDIHTVEDMEHDPYMILENSKIEPEDEPSLYQIDIAMIPDPSYADWYYGFNSDSPERLRAAVTKILKDHADKSGSTYLSRDSVVEQLENYPLYYIHKKLSIGRNKLRSLEGMPTFADRFDICPHPSTDGDVTYQLKSIRKLESITEYFVKKQLDKCYELDTPSKKFTPHLSEKLSDMSIQRRQDMYRNIFAHGLFVLSGRAGSGKTDTIVQLICHFAKNNVKPVYVVTPTGKASLVIQKRIKDHCPDMEAATKNSISISTIHKLLYSANSTSEKGVRDKYKYNLKKVLDHRLECLADLEDSVKQVKLKPRVLIIDEASMVDQAQMAVLLLTIDRASLKHLIITGDEKQLPPIGYGIPFVDTIHYLKNKHRDNNHIRLEDNLRFDSNTALGSLAGLFEHDKEPSLCEIKQALTHTDKTLEICYFEDMYELEQNITKILSEIAACADNTSIRDAISNIVCNDNKKEIKLDRIQMLAPRRVRDFGTVILNRLAATGTDQNSSSTTPISNAYKDPFVPGDKVICEKNIYLKVTQNGKEFWNLGLANGSLGYIRHDGSPYFEELEDLRQKYDYVNDGRIRDEINSKQGDSGDLKFDLGYAITVHKSQGSGFDHVLFIISDIKQFVSRELLYTGLTRTKTKLHLLIKSDLSGGLPDMLNRVFGNSSITDKKTLMFGFKNSPFRSYHLRTKDGRVLEVRSKIEWMIAKMLDESNIDFEYEPMDLYEQSKIKPDFKINGKFYVEHLGLLRDKKYSKRWDQKLTEYKNLGLVDRLITTSEGDSPHFEKNLKAMIHDIKSGTLKDAAEARLPHHYKL